jgi:dTDP-4-amino-4,6-dideoxygalactose transaminase
LQTLRSALDVTARHASVYDDALANLKSVSTPASRSVWWTYPCILREGRKRDTILAALLAEGIPCGVHFPRLLPEHPAFEQIDISEMNIETLIGASLFSRNHIVLPIYSSLDNDMMNALSAGVRDVFTSDLLLSSAADEAAACFLQRARIRSLSSGLYMFLEP